jgi:flagellar FliL protein
MRLIVLLCTLFFFSPITVAEDKEEGLPEVIYHKLNPQFTVNLQGDNHYLRTTIQLQLANDDAKEAVQEHNAAIRHALIILLSDNDADDIRTIEGRETLRKATIEHLNKTLKTYAKKEGITDVFFTEFVSQ